MSFFSRLKNIIRSNINYHSNDSVLDNSNYSAYENTFHYQEEYQAETHDTTPTSNDIENNYYAILELQPNATFEEIKVAYKKLLKKYHPDLYQNKPDKLETAKKLTAKINEAYSYFENKYK